MRHRRPHVLNAGVKGEEKWLAEAIAGIQQNAFYMHRAVDSNNLGGDEDEGIGSHVAAFDLDFLQCFGSKGMGFNLSMDVFVDGPAIWLSNGVNTGNYVGFLNVSSYEGFVFMSVVSLGVKILRNPEIRYKWEALTEDPEIGTSVYPIVLV